MQVDSRARAGCFHCASAIPARGRWRAPIGGVDRDFCCAGCLAIAETIGSAGLGSLRAALLATGEHRVARGVVRIRAVAELAHAAPAVGERMTGWPESDDSETVTAAHLRAGDIVLVRLGALVPANGVIVQGRASIEEALLTGESCPRQQAGECPLDACAGLLDHLHASRLPA